jgi:hypothetical protein
VDELTAAYRTVGDADEIAVITAAATKTAAQWADEGHFEFAGLIERLDAMNNRPSEWAAALRMIRDAGGTEHDGDEVRVDAATGVLGGETPAEALRGARDAWTKPNYKAPPPMTPKIIRLRLGRSRGRSRARRTAPGVRRTRVARAGPVRLSGDDDDLASEAAR